MRTIGADGVGDGNGVGGELLGGSAKRPTTFGPGRVCEEPGCTTRLSVYNGRTHCSVHDFDESLMNFRCPTHPEPTSHGAIAAHLPAPRRVTKRHATRVTKRHATRVVKRHAA